MTTRLRRLILRARREFAAQLRILPGHIVHIGKNGCVGIVPGKWHKERVMRERR